MKKKNKLEEKNVTLWILVDIQQHGKQDGIQAGKQAGKGTQETEDICH